MFGLGAMGRARHGRHGRAGHGTSWQGEVWHGTAGMAWTPQPTQERNLVDTTLLQVAINSALDVIWPMLPPAILDGLAYV